MRVESLRSEDKDFRAWNLAEWNRAFYRHFFATQSRDTVNAITRLYVTAEDLRVASASSAAAGARGAFIDCMKRVIGPRSLALDASRRRGQWNPQSSVLPPFLSHLLLTCMVANDLAEELRSTGDFRKRLSRVLGTRSQPGLERLLPLWKDLAAWSVHLNLEGAKCRVLQLPKIPHHGYHSIIGYSIRLAIPSRRDQAILAKLFRENGLGGREPELNSVLHVVSGNIGKFSSDFGDVFDDFVSRLKRESSSVLFYTTFWTAVREVALAGVKQRRRESSDARVRLELEDDDGTLWLALSSDKQIESSEYKSLPSPSTRQSPFRFILTDRDGNSLVSLIFSTKRAEQNTERLLLSVRSFIAEGLLLFEESEDHVFVLSNALPVSGQIRALVSDRIRGTLEQALESVEIRAEISKSVYLGWSEWRGLRLEELRKLNFSRFSSLAGVRSLRLAIVPPEIRLRAGIRIGSSFVAISGGLPQVEVSGAESVIVILREGERQYLQKLPEAVDLWEFAPTLQPAQLLGNHQIIAFTASVPIAERKVHFVETALTTHYKEPINPSRWLIESMSIDDVSYSEDPLCIIAVEEKKESVPFQRTLDNVSATHSERTSVPQQTDLLRLTISLCSRFAAQRGIPEGELVSYMTKDLGITVREYWPILRSWVEAGILEGLTDARWRARMYFGRRPQLVIHNRSGDHEAVLIGLVPPYLLDRFNSLSSASGLTRVQRRSLSAFVPALPCCRSSRLELLYALARELNLPPVLRLRFPKEFVPRVRELASHHTATSHDSWPLFRQWDWQKQAFRENPTGKTLSGISLDWCRRDDGPDRYKLYRDGSLLWWTRSRTWALLAAFTLAGESVFNRRPDAAIESRSDSLYLPLPLARFICWTGPINSGPLKLANGRTAYCYTFPDEKTRESLLARLWPEGFNERVLHPVVAKRLLTMFRPGHGPVVPIPADLKSSLGNLFQHQLSPEPGFVPVSALPYLYSTIRDLRKGKS